MKILSTKLHGLIDYVLAGAMICTPFIMSHDFTLATTIILMVGGCAMLLNSLGTNYEFGIFRNISMKDHLRIDACIAMMICLLPIFFRFDYYKIPLLYGTLLFMLSIVTHKTAYFKMFHGITYRKFEKFPSYRY
ncbi:MAG: hypothetical protein V4658_05115 [Bacteroidota bacterium]